VIGDLRNRSVVVTGASRGIGRATVELLVARGARVLAVARTEPHLHELERAHPGQVVAAAIASCVPRGRISSSATGPSS
jgi:NAD(P)-dependent dehydrogenase (short-subunit alcohol dehydrogenase family)